MTEYAYTQNNNEIIVQFQENDVAKDLSAATKIEVELFVNSSDPISRVAPATSFDSVTDGSLFDITDLVNGNLTFKPDAAALSGLVNSKYFGRFIVYSTDYSNGIIWGKNHEDLFELIVSR